MKIITVVGARPQFIKAAMISHELARHSNVSERIVHTGQHYDHGMSELFFQEMQIPEPAYNLGIKSSLHGEMVGKMLAGIEKIIIDENPACVLVYGDTNSTLAGALAARKLHVKLVHIEAGLRSFNMKMPEEINRILTDRISDLLCCPTENAMKNLRTEGFLTFPCTFFNSGDVMYDAAMYYSSATVKRSVIIARLKLKNFILATIHRAENTNDPARLKSIITALNEIHEDIPVVVPLHPRTKKLINSLGIETRFNIIEPVGYFDMLELLKHCKLVITDSGGLQKESYFFKKYCLCIREETEWLELSDAGYVIIAGFETEKIVDAYRRLENLPIGFSENFYGDGNAAVKIVNQLLKM